MHEPDATHDLLAELGYETRDIRLKPLITALCGLVLLILVSCLFCMLFYRFTSPKYREEQTLPKWVTERRLPPNPQLQSFPKDELRVYYSALDPKVQALEKAKADMTAEGIAGLTGGSQPESFHDNYPGSGKFGAPSHGEAGH